MAWFGSSDRLERLVSDHYQSLYRFAYRLSGSETEADDLTQETFCQAQVKLHQLRAAAAARGWLFAILRNVYLHRLRSRKIEKTVPLDDSNDLPDRTDLEPGPIDSAQLQEALNALPEPFRTPLVLYYFEEFSYRQIAEQMNVPLGTVMSRLARAKEFLRGQLLAADLSAAGFRQEEA